jgi:hypothetical protein
VPISKKSRPTWTAVKAELEDFDRAGLMELVQALYTASKDNQAFMHARFTLGEEPLEPYKATISRHLYPDVFKNQPVSVSKAKKAISDYKKAVGRPEGLAELAIHFCEQGCYFAAEVSMEDESFYHAIMRAYERASILVAAMPAAQREPFAERLAALIPVAGELAWGVQAEFVDCFSVLPESDSQS